MYRSYILPKHDNNDIGRWLDARLLSLPGLGSMTTFACFQALGKTFCSRQLVKNVTENFL